MKLNLKTLGVIGLLAMTLTLTGCFKVKQTLVVMPSGMGKIELSIGMSDQMVAMAKQQGEDPFSDVNPLEMAKESKGIVAFTKPQQKQEGGYTYLSFTAYFEDVNAVELSGPEGDDSTKFTYTRDGETATLSTGSSLILSGVKDYEPIPEDQKALMAGMMGGLSLSEEYVLPGSFEAIKGVTAVDNKATIEMTLDNMLNGTGPIQDFKGVEELTFKLTGVKDDKAAADAFKAELDAAVAEWQKIQKEAAGE